jgi:hypothetical protein
VADLNDHVEAQLTEFGTHLFDNIARPSTLLHRNFFLSAMSAGRESSMKDETDLIFLGS